MRATSSGAGTVPGPRNARRHAASSRWSSGVGAGATFASTWTRGRTLTPALSRRLLLASLRPFTAVATPWLRPSATATFVIRPHVRSS